MRHNIAIVAVKRYISNTLMDTEKQRTTWLFLGEFTPEKDTKNDLWDFDPTDKEAEEILHKNGLENYINTIQEKITLSEGRLRRVMLREFNSNYSANKLDFNHYFEKEIKFDTPIIFSINRNEVDDPLEKLEKEIQHA